MDFVAQVFTAEAAFIQIFFPRNVSMREMSFVIIHCLVRRISETSGRLLEILEIRTDALPFISVPE